MDILPAFEVYIDESGTAECKHRQGLKSPYAVCAIAVPVLEKESIINFLPRDTSGNLLKSSSKELTDDLCKQFVENILKKDVLISVVGFDSTAEENCSITDKLTERANENRLKKIKTPNLMYERVVAEAIIHIWGFDRINFFDLILDNNNLHVEELNRFNGILIEQFGRRNVKIRNITVRSEQQAPLLYAADIIAGIVRRWSTHKDLPKSHEVIMKGEKMKKIFIKNGFEVYNAS